MSYITNTDPFTATEPYKINPEDFECECGGTLDEDDKCDSCNSGHDDCDARDCFPCYERAMAKAEAWAEGER